MSAPKPPIIVVDRGGLDLAIFDSVEAAETHLEATDVQKGEYEAFDASGSALRLLASGNRVSIKLDEASRPSVGELRNALRAYLTAVGVSLLDSDSANNLSSLIKLCRGRE
jgi:hypothetical protein